MLPYLKLIQQHNIFKWEEGNNLTSNLFTFITLLITHKITSDKLCTKKINNEKKRKKKKKKEKKEKKGKIVRYEH